MFYITPKLNPKVGLLAERMAKNPHEYSLNSFQGIGAFASAMRKYHLRPHELVALGCLLSELGAITRRTKT
jgi:hypothetical protein